MKFLQQTGRFVTTSAEGAGYTLVLLFRAGFWLRSAFGKRREILNQMHVCGVESLPVVLVVALFSGMILALQSGIELSRYGQQRVIGALVAVTMCREFGPFMCGLICAANVGSSMAAELGTMKVSEEIDALEVMTIDPARFLVMPRLMGMVLMAPILTILTNIVGILGGATVGYYLLNVSWESYYKFAMDLLKLKDIYTGLFKSVVFGVVIASVGCSMGLRTSGGAIGVGQATRSAVVVSFLLIIILGYFLTKIFYG